MGEQAEAKVEDVSPGGLFGDARDDGAVLAQSVRHRQQERTAARDHHAFAWYGPAILDKGLHPARPHDAWQRPAGKGQKQFARAGRQN